ncbi:WD repeat-containing protein 54 isoform X2 [Thunnus thynnus]|uniref:WD repeat-containing protein 54 isoform X2 n=1 Tax=Thunnus thynnus TaxID=8237 RepID=UPI0035273A9F
MLPARLTPDHPLPFNCAVQRKLLDVSQRKEHPDQKQRVCAVQQPQRAAHRPAASHLLHGGPCQCGQHGQRLLGRPQLLPPSAAVQRAKCRYEHIAHHAAQAVFARGISAVWENYICVGVSSGAILVFDVPSKGSNITLSEVLEEHKDSITDMASECSGSQECIADLVSADDSGNLCVWKSGEEFQLLNKIPGFDMSCSSVKLWKGTVVAGYGTGQIRLYEAVTGILHAEVNAHARWIYSLDIAPFSGLLLSAAEDSLVRVWHLTVTPESNSVEVAHLHNECVTDTQICGAKFCDGDGYAFAVTGYDLSEIIRYTQS